MSRGTEQRKLAAFTFTDMVGYSTLARRYEKLVLLLLIAACVTHAADTVPQESSKGSTNWQSIGERLVIRVNDHEVLNPIASGHWRLGGTLEVQFVEPIDPHENSVFQLCGPGVAGIEGKFAQVIFPKGWRYDLRYDESARQVTL